MITYLGLQYSKLEISETALDKFNSKLEITTDSLISQITHQINGKPKPLASLTGNEYFDGTKDDPLRYLEKVTISISDTIGVNVKIVISLAPVDDWLEVTDVASFK